MSMKGCIREINPINANSVIERSLLVAIERSTIGGTSKESFTGARSKDVARNSSAIIY